MNVSFVRDSFDGFALAILVFYMILGAFRPSVKSVVSLMLLPLVLLAYLWVPALICKNFFVPKNLLMLVALVAGSFILVFLGKWLLSIFLNFIFRGKPSLGFQFWTRLAGVLIAMLEGVCVFIVACWMLDFFDRLGGKKLESFYESLNHNPIYSQVAEQNPIYRMAVARKIKYVLMAHTVPEAFDKIGQTPIFRELLETEAIQKIRNDSELQTMIEKGQWFYVLKHPKLYDFMRSEDVFSIMTSLEFVEASRLSLPDYLLDEILKKS